MPRRAAAHRRELPPDPVYKSVLVTQITNKILQRGKRGTAEKIVYDAMDIIAAKTGGDPLATVKRAVDNVKPQLEVKSRRVGGATYQVPVEVRPERREALAIRWLIAAAKSRNENTMEERLAGELADAVQGRGSAVKKREDTHKMADANKAFSHYRW